MKKVGIVSCYFRFVTKRNILMAIQERVYDISKVKHKIDYKPEMTM